MTESAAISRRVGSLGNEMSSGSSTSRFPIVADKASYFGVAEGVDEQNDVADEVQGAKVREVNGSTRRGRATVTALVECNDVVAG